MLAVSFAPTEPAAAARGRLDVLVITLDTTRADHLGCYGYARPTSPHLDRLCQASHVYTRGFATSSWTLPSHASLFTGKFSSSHGAINDEAGPLKLSDEIEGPEGWARYAVRPLAEGETTLAEILTRHGYRTGAVVAGPWLKRSFGLSQGFSSYDDAEISSLEGRRADSVTESAIRFLEAPGPDDTAPFFLFLNYYDPHIPYLPPVEFARPFVRRLEGGMREDADWRKIALYDAEIAYMDSQIGRLFARLGELGKFDETLIVVTADHGELLGEHGEWGHGYHLTQQELRVPFILKLPAGSADASPRRIDVPVQLVDVLPLVLEMAGFPRPEGIQGRSPRDAVRHPIVAEVYPLHTERWVGDWRASVKGTSKLLCNSLGNDALFELASDPAEAVNLIASPSQGASRRCDELLQYLASLPRPAALGPSDPVGEETRKALESLGYLDSRDSGTADSGAAERPAVE